jgi:hypothetical protein
MDYQKELGVIREDVGAAYGPEEQARFDALKHCNPAGILADCFPGLYHLYKAGFMAELAREWFNRTFPERAI